MGYRTKSSAKIVKIVHLVTGVVGITAKDVKRYLESVPDDATLVSADVGNIVAVIFELQFDEEISDGPVKHFE